ncbi:19247_t:CDS:2 [Rhizophagus irregularis]|nr:19247_t:CDS:2 [Rhizophagus irregularis]
MDIPSTRQEDNISNLKSEIEINSVSAEGSLNENTGDSTGSLLDKESQSTDSVTAIEKNKEYIDDPFSVTAIEKNKEYNDDPLTEPNLSVTEDNDNIITTQKHQDYDDQELLFVNREDNGDSDHMVSSIHTSDDTASENSLSMSSGMLVSPDVRTPSSPSQNSEDNNSIESMPTGDVMDSNSNSPNRNEYFDLDLPVVPAPGETRSQILAPLDDNENEDYDGSRIQLTPIITKAVETDDDPPSPTLRQNLDFRHRQNSSLGEIAMNIFHHQILLPFFQGFSWGIGIHLYRYMRSGFSIRNFLEIFIRRW